MQNYTNGFPSLDSSCVCINPFLDGKSPEDFVRFANPDTLCNRARFCYVDCNSSCPDQYGYVKEICQSRKACEHHGANN